MNRYFIELAYLGTHYHGWQIQPDQKTVQKEITDALKTLLKHTIDLVGCGRTDAGVHASYYVAHFESLMQLNHEELQHLVYQLNQILSRDITIYGIQPVDNEAHARFSAVKRTYVYLIDLYKNPFHQQTKTFYRGSLNFELMNEGAEFLLEIEDFETFSKAHADNKTTICKVDEAFWTFNDDVAKFRICSDRFLRNMVRAIVGTLFDLGRDKISIEEFKKIALSKDRSKAGPSAPPEGLYLSDIVYPNNTFKSIHSK